MSKKGDFRTLGVSAYSLEEREINDFYATDPIALEKFLDESGIELNNVWECACGEGHLAKVLDEIKYTWMKDGFDADHVWCQG